MKGNLLLSLLPKGPVVFWGVVEAVANSLEGGWGRKVSADEGGKEDSDTGGRWI